jgi:hypothetical protein
MREPVFTETLQVALVVRDLDAATRTYFDEYGIGPWSVYEFDPGNVKDMRSRGEPVAWSWRLAVAQVGLLTIPLAVQVSRGLGPNYENPYGLMAIMGVNVQLHLRAGLLLLAAYAVVLALGAVAPSVSLFLGWR